MRLRASLSMTGLATLVLCLPVQAGDNKKDANNTNKPAAAKPAASKPATTNNNKPAPTNNTKTNNNKPAAAAAPKNNGALGQLTTLHQQQPNSVGGSMRPNQQASGNARKGWDTPAQSKPPVQAGKSQPTTAAEKAKAANQQHQKEQKDLAKKYPATGKAPPSPQK